MTSGSVSVEVHTSNHQLGSGYAFISASWLCKAWSSFKRQSWGAFFGLKHRTSPAVRMAFNDNKAHRSFPKHCSFSTDWRRRDEHICLYMFLTLLPRQQLNTTQLPTQDTLLIVSLQGHQGDQMRMTYNKGPFLLSQRLTLGPCHCYYQGRCWAEEKRVRLGKGGHPKFALMKHWLVLFILFNKFLLLQAFGKILRFSRR